MRTHALLIAIALTGGLLLLAGCGGGGGSAVGPDGGTVGSAQFLGTWLLDSGVTPALTETALKNASTDAVTFKFADDGTLHVAEFSDDSLVANSVGSWSCLGQEADLTWSACETTFTARVDGDTLVLVAHEGTPDEIELHLRAIEEDEVGNLGQG